MGAKADLYLQYLRKEGYVPKLDDDGDVIFKKEGVTYLLYAEEEDPSYFRLVCPMFWEIESDAERSQAVVAAVEASRQIKVAKVFLVGSHVWASVEQLIDPIDDFERTFPRLLRTLRAGALRFAEEMRDEG